jgi:hypothetical protein
VGVRVRVRIEDFEDGVLPDVCVWSGGTPDRFYRATFSKSPRWIWLLLFVGPFGFLFLLVASFAFQKSASGFLPYADAVQRRIRQRRREFGVAAVVAFAIAAFGWSLADSYELRALAAVLVGAGALTLLLCGFLTLNPPGLVDGRVDSTNRWVELGPVHPNFAAAYARQEESRRAGRRAEVGEGQPR